LKFIGSDFREIFKKTIEDCQAMVVIGKVGTGNAKTGE